MLRQDGALILADFQQPSPCLAISKVHEAVVQLPDLGSKSEEDPLFMASHRARSRTVVLAQQLAPYRSSSNSPASIAAFPLVSSPPTGPPTG